MKQIFITKAIIKDNQKILLLRRASGTQAYIGLYELPGGKVDFGEDPKTAIGREVREETGRNIQTLQLYNTYTIIDSVQPEKQYIVAVFVATLEPGNAIQLSSEHNKYIWKSMSNIQLNEVTDITKTALNLGYINHSAPEATVINKSNEVKNTSKIDHAIIYCDGGSRGNPGPSASGYVIYDSQELLLAEGGKYLGITTNNQAEYQAVKLALEKAQELGIRHMQFRLDSQLVVNQLTGLYQIRNRDLWPIHTSIKQLISTFEKVTFTHVRREFNTVADAIVNKILNEYAHR